jgi:hypothetical protein
VKHSVLLSTAALFAMGSQFGMCQEPPSRTQPPATGFFQIGQMREAIGQGQSGGRIRLGDVADREHFFGVGAVAALGGVVGTFRDVRVHVINGACPLHARRAGLTLDEPQRPFEATYESTSGTIVGVYAKGKAGVLTHPGTSTHMHLIYVEPRTGVTVTAHVEKIGFGPDCVLMLAKR